MALRSLTVDQKQQRDDDSEKNARIILRIAYGLYCFSRFRSQRVLLVRRHKKMLSEEIFGSNEAAEDKMYRNVKGSDYMVLEGY